MSKEFLVYKTPSQSLVVYVGTWAMVKSKTKNGFLISDAFAENFWQFHPERTAEMPELIIPELQEPDLQFISEEDYLNRASSLIAEMKEKSIEKVVYSRIKSVPFEHKDLFQVFEKLMKHYPNNFNYCLYNAHTGLWMGSSPEILIQGNDNHYQSMALAGTLPSDASDDLWTHKEYEEQALVSQYLENLIHLHGNLTDKKDRYIVQVGPVKHLRNDYLFVLEKDKFWNFLEDFHPTPAVCGVPKYAARGCYEKYEAHRRSLYTGIIGFVDSDAQNEKLVTTSLYVNLRCMQIFKNRAALYVGGGFTRDSDPMKEWLETERKSETLARFL